MWGNIREHRNGKKGQYCPGQVENGREAKEDDADAVWS